VDKGHRSKSEELCVSEHFLYGGDSRLKRSDVDRSDNLEQRSYRLGSQVINFSKIFLEFFFESAESEELGVTSRQKANFSTPGGHEHQVRSLMV
jgi:hypothetical protein